MRPTKFSFAVLFAAGSMLVSACGGGEKPGAISQGEKAVVQSAAVTSQSSDTKGEVTGATKGAAETELSIEEALLKRGRIVWFKCRSCHETSLEGPHKVGPNLHGLMNAKVASKEGFIYSEAMTNSGIIWTEEVLDAFIEKPSAYIKGSKMAFVGIKKESDRRAVIAYIKENTKPSE